MTTAMTVRPAPTATGCSICGNDCAKERAITQDNDVICYPCAARAELAAFDANPARYSGYITAGKYTDWGTHCKKGYLFPRDSRSCNWQGATVSTWTGEPLAIVTGAKATNRRTLDWVGDRLYSVWVRNPRTGATYRGLTYGPGMYVSLTRTGAEK